MVEARVAIVTGGGGSIGRAVSVALAAQGVSVVVSGHDGESCHADRGMAAVDATVAQIRKLGGAAVADYSGVESLKKAHAVVRMARQSFGPVSILVNNAGIIADRKFQHMREADFDRVVRTNVYGAFYVTRAAWPDLVFSGTGRVINMTSAVGLWGNAGQVNYAVSKAGIVGLTRSLALEGVADGVLVNAVAPVSASRLTKEVLDDTAQQKFSPAYVAALVAYLASPVCALSGATIEAGGGYYARVLLAAAPALVAENPPTVDSLAAHFTSSPLQKEPASARHAVELMCEALGVQAPWRQR
ncbi:SDR family NAD(P)-dependent oxidoreductase [Streptomyces chartreusis]|uniref:SDR family NAD(P)-dependent oxidoreductase n=1 Tax=Streptomyces chartreusis TaxID=1969 RepID=UPI00381EB8F9